jgi:hypothetical protein
MIWSQFPLFVRRPFVLVFAVVLAGWEPACATVAEGRAALTQRTPVGLQLAYDKFAAALPTAEARLLKAATGLALELTRPGFRSELERVGIKVVDPNIYNFIYEEPVDANGFFRPTEGVMTDAALAYILSRRGLADEALASLNGITDENFLTSLSAAETALMDVQVDFADVCLLRAFLHTGKALVALAESYNLSAEYALFYRLATQEKFNPQELLAALPAALKYSSKKAERVKARDLLLAAHAEFKKAYAFIGTKRVASTTVPYLFEFADPQGAEQLDTELQALADSMLRPVMFPDAPAGQSLLGGQRLDLSKFFSSTAPAPRDLFPRYFDRGFFRRGADSWPDLTIGGIFPEATPDFPDRALLGARVLQNTLYHPYSFSLLIRAPEPGEDEEAPAEEPIFGRIRAIAVDPEGNLYVADDGDHVIRKVARDGTVTTVAGQKWRTWKERDELVSRAYAGGTGDDAYIRTWNDAPSDIFTYGPGGIACDHNGNVYFTEHHRVMRLAPDGRLTNLAGRPSSSSGYRRGRDGVGAQAVIISYPGELACDTAGNVYLCDAASVRRISPSGVVTTVAGIPGWDKEARGYVDGPRAVARLGSYLKGIAVDANGNIFVNDINNSAVRKIQPDGTTSTVAGGPNAPKRHLDAEATGTGLVAGLADPRGLAIGPGGLLVFGDGPTVRGLLPNGTVATLGGHPDRRGFVMGAGDQARFRSSGSQRLQCFAIDARGTLYAANKRGDIVRGLPAATTLADVTFPAPPSYPQPPPDEQAGPPWPQVPPTLPVPEAGTLGSFALSTDNIVLSGSDATLGLTGTYRGDLASLWVYFTSSTGQSFSFNFYGGYYLNTTEPRTRDRVLSMLQTIPSYWPEGEWTASAAYWHWQDGTSGSMSPDSEGWNESSLAGLVFTVENDNSDTVPPQIIAVEAMPDGARSGAAEDQVLQVFATITDSESGLIYASISFHNELTGQSLSSEVSFDLFAIDPASGRKTYRAPVRIPAGTEAADWSIHSLYMIDRVGNSIYFISWYDTSEWYADYPEYAPLPEHLQGVVFKTGPEFPVQPPFRDRRAPRLTGLDFMAPTADVTRSHASVDIRLQITDDLAGFSNGFLGLVSVDGNESVFTEFSNHDLVQGNVLDGTYTVTAILPRGAIPGSWTVDYLSLTDNQYNERYYSHGLPPGVTPTHLTVESDGRRERPVLRGVEVVLPDELNELDTWAGDQTISVRIMVTQPEPHQPNEWNEVGSVGLRSPSGTQYLWSDFSRGHLVEGNAVEGTYEIVFRLPQFSEEGMWQVDYVELEDTYSWTAFYFSAIEFAAAGLPAAQREFTVKGVPRTWEQFVFSLAPPPQTISIDLSNLTLSFSGAEQFAAATVVGAPPDVDLSGHIVFTYNGLTTAPILPGEYDVVAFLDHLAYTGRATGKMTITGMVSNIRIRTQPSPVEIFRGEPASFNVVAEAAGGGPLRYAWHRNNKPVAGGTRADLSLTATRQTAGRYKVKVTDVDSGDFVWSDEAELSLRPAARWVWDPDEPLRVVAGGEALTLLGKAEDIPPFSGVLFQWLKDGLAIKGATTPSLAIEAARPGDAGLYSVRVTTNAGRVESSKVRVVLADDTVLIYRVSARERTWDHSGQSTAKLQGFLVLDRQLARPQGAFVWQGKEEPERLEHLAAHSTGPGRGTMTVASRVLTSGSYPNQDQETIWLAGRDRLVPLSAQGRFIMAPASLSGWILTKTHGDRNLGLTVNNLSLTLDRQRTGAHAEESFEEVLEAVQADP